MTAKKDSDCIDPFGSDKATLVSVSENATACRFPKMVLATGAALGLLLGAATFTSLTTPGSASLGKVRQLSEAYNPVASDIQPNLHSSKDDVVDAIKKGASISKAQAVSALDLLLALIMETLERDEAVSLGSFGTFSRKESAATRTRSKKCVPKFSGGSDLNEVVQRGCTTEEAVEPLHEVFDGDNTEPLSEDLFLGRSKSDLIDEMAQKLSSLSKNVCERVVDVLVDVVTQTLSKDTGTLVLGGFGTFSVKEKPARESTDPTSGKTIWIPATCIPVFAAADDFKEVINSSCGILMPHRN